MKPGKSSWKIAYFFLSLCLIFSLSACGGASSSQGSGSTGNNDTPTPAANKDPEAEGNTTTDNAPVKGSRDNSPNCLVPYADGTLTMGNDVTIVDYSNSAEGYISVNYTGTAARVKLRITGPDEILYTYDLKTDGTYEVFPLTGGNGTYTIAIYENISGTEYSTGFYDTLETTLNNELLPFLYPNQYVNFTPNSNVVSTASELVYSANSDLEAVSMIYNYIISNITYDYEFAASSPTGYIPEVDQVLKNGTGICLDYASVMCSMLRSQGIPARLEIGYAADAYHAWLSVYIDDIGWVNGIVEFSGEEWTLMDPTFGASTDDTTLKKFIGDGTNYTLQKIY